MRLSPLSGENIDGKGMKGRAEVTKKNAHLQIFRQQYCKNAKFLILGIKDCISFSHKNISASDIFAAFLR